MAKISLYQKYLLLDMLMQRIESLGVAISAAGVSVPRWDDWRRSDDPVEKTYSFMHHAHVDIELYDAQKREDFTDAWLAAYPETELVRKNGDIYLRGTSGMAGPTWLVSVGKGVCERVQVGTKKVRQIDPAYLENAPMVEVEEPVFETICADPLRELVGA